LKLFIDAGHGMSNRKLGVYDPGAVSSGVQEADVALAWALTLKYVFSQAGIKTHLSRASAEHSSPLSKRLNIAHGAECTHLISLHCNASGNPLASGVETFVRTNPRGSSMDWANIVQDACLEAMLRRDRGVKSEGQSQHKRLAILQSEVMRSCLLEIGFVTNPSDRKRMLDRDVRVAFAENLLRAVRG